jgi:hypothetical protein
MGSLLFHGFQEFLSHFLSPGVRVETPAILHERATIGKASLGCIPRV